MNDRQPKVLLIRLSSLGDLILSTAAVEPLRAAGFSVSLVTKAEFLPVLEGQAGIEEIFAFDKKPSEAAARESFFVWAAAQEFQFILDLQNSWRTWTWRRRLRKLAPVHVLPKPRLREWLVLYLRLGRWFGFGRGGRARRFRGAAERALSKQLNISRSLAPLTNLEVRAEEKEAVRTLLPEGEFLVLLPAGAWKSKEWPYFVEFAKLVARKVPVVVLGGAKDGICEKVAAAAREVNPKSRSLHGRTSMKESLAILANARWVVGNDTGMVHAAEALGKDVAMIEGPTHPYLGFSLYRDKSLVVGLPLVCRPCSKSGKFCMRFGSRLCLNGLLLEDVAARLRERGFPC